MMLHVPEVLTREQVRHVLSELEKAEWIDGRATVGPQGAQVKQNLQLPETSPAAIEMGKLVLAALAKRDLYFSGALPRKILPPMFNCYQNGGHYGAHVDASIRTIPGGNAELRTDVSSTLFLTDPDSYEGGELIVTDTYGEHEVKLAAGDLILYPSTSLHRVEPVLSGQRICAFFWVQSMVRDDWRRGMLFDLDQNIRVLRTQLGDTAEVLSLTAHYHNLLRQWADV